MVKKKGKLLVPIVLFLIVLLLFVGFFSGLFDRFTGNVVNSGITGNPILNPNIYSNRILPSIYTQEVPIVINITVNFDSNSCGGAVVETIPVGWSVFGISGSGSGIYNSADRTIRWAPVDGPLCGGQGSYTLGYIATPDATQSGTKTFVGILSADGESYAIGGNDAIAENLSLFTIYSPREQDYNYSRIPINVTLSRAVPYLRYVDYRPDGRISAGVLCSNCKDWGYSTLKTLSLIDGSHQFRIYSSDNFINQSLDLFVDATIPKISSQIPSNKSYCNGSFALTYTEAYPTRVVLHYANLIAEKTDCPSGSSKKCVFLTDAAQYELTNVSYYFEIQDTFRKVSGKTHTCSVDTIPPQIESAQLSQAGRYIYFNVSVAERARYIKYVDYSKNPATIGALCSSCQTYGYSSVQRKAFARGNHSLAVLAVDAAGNTAQSDIFNFTIV